MLKRWRKRRAFKKAVGAATKQATEDVAGATETFRAEIDPLRRSIADLPGTNPLCPNCGTRLAMKPTKDGRRWWNLWTCRGCGERVRLADYPRGSIRDGVE